MKIMRLILLSFTLLLINGLAAQTILTGKVIDKSFNSPLPGANIYVSTAGARSLAGTITNMNGEYRLQVPNRKDLTIVCSFIGYKSITIKYTGQKVLNFSLEDNNTLQVVQVTGRAIKKNSLGQSERELVSATQKVMMDKVETAPVTSLTEALQGAMANVDILTGADPGAKASIRIRGTSSLNASADPLFVLDGVPLPVNVSSDFNFATATSEDYGDLLNISPTDIESIEVLKDAAATAMWGSRGSNGVLLITTKKGSKGRLKFSFSTKSEFRKEGSSIPLLDSKQYVSMMQDAIWNSVRAVGEGSNEALTLLSLLYDTKEIGYDPKWLYFDEYNQNTKWLDEITRTGISLDNNFSLSGGGDKADYRLSLGYLDETGTLIGTSFRRFSTTFNMTYKFSNKFDINTVYSFTNGLKNSPYDTPRSQALTKMPNMSPYIIGQDGQRTEEYFTPFSYFQGSYANQGLYNPVAMANESRNQSRSVTSRMVFNLHYNFFKGLDYFSVLGFDARTTKGRKYLPQEVIGESYIYKEANLSTDAGNDVLYLTTENRLIFNKAINTNNRILISAIAQTTNQSTASYTSTVKGGASSQIIDPTAEFVNTGAGSGAVNYRSFGGLMNMQYTLFDKYLFNAGYRMEASSSLSPKSRWGGFPTVGVAWQLGDEKFMEPLHLSIAKIRVNWGQSANSPSGSAPYVGAFSAIPNGYGQMAAIQPISIQLTNLKFETVTQSNLGIDVGILKGRVNFSVDVYKKVTDDLLQKDVNLPSSTGFASVKFYNSGKMQNSGWEFRTDFQAIKSKDFSFNIDFNISQNKNEIIDMPENKQDMYYTFGNKNFAYMNVAGNPVGSFYGYKSLGVYQNVEETYAHDLNGNLINDINGKPVVMKNGSVKVYPGDAKYQDVNGDGLIDKNDIVYLGNCNPLLIGGFGLNFRYKTWGLVATFQGRAGQKAINAVRMNNENMYGKDNQSAAVLRRWRNEGDDTEIPRALYNRGFNTLGSDRFIEDASFLRLKTLTLKYDLPKNLITKMKIDGMTIYLTGYDLWTLTKYTGQDPEINLSTENGLYTVCIDKASTPKPFRVAAGLNIKF